MVESTNLGLRQGLDQLRNVIPKASPGKYRCLPVDQLSCFNAAGSRTCVGGGLTPYLARYCFVLRSLKLIVVKKGKLECPDPVK